MQVQEEVVLHVLSIHWPVSWKCHRACKDSVGSFTWKWYIIICKVTDMIAKKYQRKTNYKKCNRFYFNFPFCILKCKCYIDIMPTAATYANSADPDQTPQNAASDQSLHCFLTGISNRSRIKMKKVHQPPIKLEMDSSNWYGWTAPLLRMRHLLEGGFSHITTLWHTVIQVLSCHYLVFL